MNEKKQEIKKVSLPSLPKDEFYEDYVSAIFAACGLFVERRISLNEPVNILELDIVTSEIHSNKTEKTIVEIKSGQWGLTDVFKIRGWLDYLQYSNAAFIGLQSNKLNFGEYQNIASSLQINLIDIPLDGESKLDDTVLIKSFNLSQPETHVYESAVPTLRFAFVLERYMIEKYLCGLAKDAQALPSYKLLKKYINQFCNHSFFISDAHKRLISVFEAYIENKNITARIDYEKLTGTYPSPDGVKLSEAAFSDLFYSIPNSLNPLHIALYAELQNRLTILKLSVEEYQSDKSLTGLMRTVTRLSLPSNIKDGIDKLAKNPQFHRYPILWQNFIYVMGGFILKDRLNDEYHILSKLSGVPEEEVETALTAFDVLFPLSSGTWFFDKPYTTIKILQFMPLPFSGLGANFRRIYYRADDQHYSYDDLGKLLTGQYTLSDLNKFNNLAVEYLTHVKGLECQP